MRRPAPRSLAATAALCTALALTAHAPAQTAWQRQSCLPTPVDLTAAEFLPDGTLVAVGDDTTIVRSTDGGMTWEVTSLGFNDRFRDVFFLDGLRGWTAGSRQFRTLDGGATWIPYSNFGPGEAVAFLDAQNGVGVGATAIYRSSDGGDTWTWETAPGGAQLFDLEFANSETGWAVGKNGVILVTHDAGASWQTQPAGTADWLYDVEAVSLSEVWIAAQNGLLHTTDGGASWSPVALPAGAQTRRVRFVDALVGYACGWDQQVYATTDGGSSWSLVHEQREGGFLDDLAFRDALNGFAVGADGLMYQTSDGGMTWVQRASGVGAIVTDIQALDEDTVFAATEGNAFLASFDGGRFWRASYPLPDEWGDMLFDDLHMLDARTGWLTGEILGSARGRVLRTDDGGATWDVQLEHVNHVYLNIEAFDAQTLIAAGFNIGIPFNQPLIMRSTDGGLTWTNVSPTILTADEWYGMEVLDADTAFLCGDVVARSDDKGLTWTVLYNDEVSDFLDVSFASDTHGWAVGGVGTVIRTTNGGASWTSQDLGLGFAKFTSVEAVGPDEAWIASADGFVAHTTDGGASWSIEATGADVGEMEALPGGPVWIVGHPWLSPTEPHGGIFKRAPVNPPVCTSSAASFAWSGLGTAGTDRVPMLLPGATPAAGQPLGLFLESSTDATANAFVGFGVVPSAVPFRGGTLLLEWMSLVTVPLPQGGLPLPFDVPADPIFCGATVLLQLYVLDAGAPQGLAFSPRLDLTIGD